MTHFVRFLITKSLIMSLQSDLYTMALYSTNKRSDMDFNMIAENCQ